MPMQIIIICKSVNYYSTGDETRFFEWLKDIFCIKEVEGRGEELYLIIKTPEIDDADLRELIALFQRYKIENIEQLAFFLNKKNEVWFSNKKAYWYRKIFVKK